MIYLADSDSIVNQYCYFGGGEYPYAVYVNPNDKIKTYYLSNDIFFSYMSDNASGGIYKYEIEFSRIKETYDY